MVNNPYLDFLASFGIGGAHPGGMPLTIELLQTITIKPEHRLLDVGCGTGQTSAFIKKTYGSNVTALDIHPGMIEKARARFYHEQLDIALVQGNAEQLPFNDNSFDILLIESVTVFTTIKKSINEYARVLKPGGILLNLEMTANDWFSAAELAEIQRVYGIQEVPSEEQWINYLQDAGLTVTEVLNRESVRQKSIDSISEFDFGKLMDFSLYTKWMEHINLMEKMGTRLGFRIYKCIK
ncbi:class I SAM-dependent methyltransferase [Pseudalkalibacillus caeni]|uniref:Methyltransferase domain-containing protein n=1 Tax=Exobacillus caeni TaxID=2574798 RepID=A0A5R9F7I4_9BACL|nr:class I SAM-dependent methyltransferase [Pseudalkalibacillus caeni]TLS38220.1 methyltransferase domain-containing protein [Pseudalkalibacillus caeni]